MMTIEDVYRKFDEIGCCSFATPDRHGGVEARIAHFFAYDDEGLYLRTMDVKPFYRQLKESGRLAVCGERTEAKVVFDEDNLPLFKPGYQMRVSGEVRELSMAEVEAKAAHDRNFNVAVHDIAKYPETRVLVLHRFHGELYDYDYAMARRDHKLYRERFAFGGDTYEEPGLRITDSCIACGTCLEGCSFKAIVPGEPYAILGERCDECGNCYHVCPAGAVEGKGRPGPRLPALYGAFIARAAACGYRGTARETITGGEPWTPDPPAGSSGACGRSAGSRSSSSPSSWAWATRPCRSGSAGAAAPTCRFCPRSRPSWDAR